MTPKQDKYLFYFICCAIIVAFFAMVGGCTRSCTRKIEKNAQEYEKRTRSRRRYYNNSIIVFNLNRLCYGNQL